MTRTKRRPPQRKQTTKKRATSYAPKLRKKKSEVGDTYRAYMRWVNKEPLCNKPFLPQKEIVKLVLRAQKGDLEARNKVILSNLKLVVKIAFRFEGKYHPISLERLDLIQAGNLGLIHAIEKFRLEKCKGKRPNFITYAGTIIERCMGREFENLEGNIRTPVHIHRARIKIRNAVNELRNQQKIITVEEIAKITNLSPKLINDSLKFRVYMIPLEGTKETEKGIFDLINVLPSKTNFGRDLRRRDFLHTINNTLNAVYAHKRDKEIWWERVIEGRTLHEIGREHNLTYERVRQIVNTGNKKIRVKPARDKIEKIFGRSKHW